MHSPSEAIAAGARLLGKLDLVGKTKKEVLEVLSGLIFTSYYEGENEVLIYSFDSGRSGVGYRLFFDQSRVLSVKAFGIN